MKHNIVMLDEQEDFIVIFKPTGTSFHDENELGTGLFNCVKEQFGFRELYPIHRLDKITSGLILFAKNLSTAQTFQQLFEEHKIEKYYIALSDKKPTKKQGLIKGDMVKSRRSAWKLLRSNTNPAISQFFSYGVENGIRLYIIKPHTGKTHQIRVALSSIGSPIMGDPNYYPSSKAKRGYLHAFALRFRLGNCDFEYINHPTEGSEFLHAKVIDIIDELSTPWLLPWPKV